MGQRKYEKEYKVQEVNLAQEIGAGKAAHKLGIPADTRCMGGRRRLRERRLDGARQPYAGLCGGAGG